MTKILELQLQYQSFQRVFGVDFEYLCIISNTAPPVILALTSPFAAAAAKSLHSCPTLCDPIDGSPSGSPIPGILQARTLDWVAISFSNAEMSETVR